MAERLTPSRDILIVQPELAVDNEGNILYDFWPAYGTGDNFRVRTVNGTIIPIDDLGLTRYFFSYSGNIYVNIGEGSYTNRSYKFYKLEITRNSIDNIELIPVFNIDNGYSVYGRFYYFPDKMVIVGENYLASFYKNGTQEIVVLNENIGENIKTGSSDFFILDNNEIYKIDPKTGEKQTLIFKNEYDVIYYFEVTSNDIIIINTLTFDGKKILANIYPDGSREIISENFEKSETVILEKIR